MSQSDAFLLLVIVGGAAIAMGYLGTGVFGSGNVSSIVQTFAQAIATAEGFYVSGSVAQRQNNPGNIESNGIINTYTSADEGWAALYAQVQGMFSGSSSNYNPGMTIAQVGDIYSGGDPNWANNVAAALGVTTDTTLQSLEGSNG